MMKWIVEFATTFLFLYKTSIIEISKVEVNIGVTLDFSSMLQCRLLWFSLNTSCFTHIKIIRNLNETKFNLNLLKIMDSILLYLNLEYRMSEIQVLKQTCPSTCPSSQADLSINLFRSFVWISAIFPVIVLQTLRMAAMIMISFSHLATSKKPKRL